MKMDKILKEVLDDLVRDSVTFICAYTLCDIYLADPKTLPVEREYAMKQKGNLRRDLDDIRFIFQNTLEP